MYATNTMFDYYIGIDPSITGTAITIISEDLSFIKTAFFTEKKKHKSLQYQYFKPFICPDNQRNNGNDKFFNLLTNWIVNSIEDYLNEFSCKIVIEGYSFSSVGKVFSIAEFVGLLKHKIAITRSWFYESIPPSSIKKFILKGNSNKTDLFSKFMIKNIYDIESVNPDWVCEFKKFIADETLKVNFSKIGSPLGDIMDSLYISLYARERILNS